jgi:glycogen debranching enzyme
LVGVTRVFWKISMTGDPVENVVSASSNRSPKKGGAEKNRFYILAPAPYADEHTRVLKQGDTFAVFDHYGDITTGGLREQGIYHQGTRFLSSYVLVLGQDRPLFLSSTVKEDNDVLVADLTNPDMHREGRVLIPRGTLHIFRAKFLWQGSCYERLHFKNYGLAPLKLSFLLHFEADFADVFEVRGMKRQQRGRYLEEPAAAASAVLAYQGLDGKVRRTRLLFDPPPVDMADDEARFEVSLRPQEEAAFQVTITCAQRSVVHASAYDDALAALAESFAQARSPACAIRTPNAQFNSWVNRNVADLHMMTTVTTEGPYPYAGVPWFSTPFGRDGIITALECLWINPALARGVLAYLAANQANAVVADQDAEPGKILHETRHGEMAALGEIPFGRYYGSVDATPLFVMLADAYYRRSGDRAFIRDLWPHVERALQWIDTYGDADGDGFVEYSRHSSQGLLQQGWKDSHDSVFHHDGSLARGPIALCEVQGYVFAAKRGAAVLASTLALPERARQLDGEAQKLQRHFEEVFWCEELGTCALALDGNKRPCRVRASNAGHGLFTGIVAPERARRLGQTLLRAQSFSGWGIRTLDEAEARYNPMSYHNGSVWPHDNALIAAGLGRYGMKEGVVRLMAGLYDASVFLDLHRLPELFCGFIRRPGEGPTLYPVACAPQAWSAAAAFLLLQACLGLEIHGPEQKICFAHPVLPEFLPEVRLENLAVGTTRVDLLLLRHEGEVGINVLRKQGDVEIVVTI